MSLGGEHTISLFTYGKFANLPGRQSLLPSPYFIYTLNPYSKHLKFVIRTRRIIIHQEVYDDPRIRKTLPTADGIFSFLDVTPREQSLRFFVFSPRT